LNKIDIFREKLPVSPMSHYFPEFRGDDQSYDQTSAFLLDKFVGLNQNLDKSIYAVSPA
jgi:guanine nucleotide-binding protein subunit alpha